MQLLLTTIQRMSLVGIINSQKPKEVDDLLLLRDIKLKVRLTEDQEGSLLKSLPGGQVLVDRKAAEKIPPLPVELERAEMRKVQSLLEGWLKSEGVSVDDAEWYIPLTEAVKDALSVAKRE